MTYNIEKIAENTWGLFDSESETPELPVVICHDECVLCKVMEDFIQCDKAEKKRKAKK